MLARQLPTGEKSDESEDREEKEDESRQAPARASWDYGGISAAAMEKLKVWVDEVSDGELSDTGR